MLSSNVAFMIDEGGIFVRFCVDRFTLRVIKVIGFCFMLTELVHILSQLTIVSYLCNILVFSDCFLLGNLCCDKKLAYNFKDQQS